MPTAFSYKAILSLKVEMEKLRRLWIIDMIPLNI